MSDKVTTKGFVKHGPCSKEQIDSLKQAFPDTPMFSIPFGKKGVGDEYVFRTLTRVDVQALSKYMERPDPNIPNAVRVVSHALLWPMPKGKGGPEGKIQALLDTPIGRVMELEKAVLEKSGFHTRLINGDWVMPSINLTKIQDPTGWKPPTEEQIEHHKNQQADLGLHKISISGIYHFLVKPVTVKEVMAAAQAADETMALISTSVVWPEDKDLTNLPAYNLSLLEKVIRNISGSSDEQVESYDLFDSISDLDE